jgi:hypothetical protein
METGEQHAVGVVLGGPGGDRPDCDVGAAETLQNTYSTDYLRKQSAGLFRSQAPQDGVDCEALVGKSFRLDGEEWEVIEDRG